MTVLILGYGYVGAALAHRLHPAGQRIVAMDNFFSTPEPAARAVAESDSVELLRGDITSSADLRRAFGRAGAGAVVVLLASQPSSHPAAASPELTEAVNVTGARLVFEACERHDAQHLVFGSSTRVYGRYPSGCIDESSPYGVAPDLPHLTKIYAEQYFSMEAAARAGIPVTSARLALVYGVGPIMKTDRRFMTAPNRFCLDAVVGRPLLLQQGTGRPDNLLHVEDVADALITILEGPAHASHQTVNVVGTRVSVRQVALLIAELASQRGLRVALEDESGGDVEDGSDITSVLERRGWKAKRSLSEGLRETIDHFARIAACGFS